MDTGAEQWKMFGEITTELYPNDQIVTFFKFKNAPNFMVQMNRDNAEQLFDSLARTLGYKAREGGPHFKHQLKSSSSRLQKAELVCRTFERWYFHTNAANWEELKHALKDWSDSVAEDLNP